MINWKVELSDGKTFIEGTDPFNFIKNEKSPWLRLKDYISAHKVKITSLSLISGEQTFSLPSHNNNPKFTRFVEQKEPIGFNWFTMLGLEKDKKEVFKVIEAVYIDYKLQIWVDESNGNCWALTAPIVLD